MIRVAHFRKVSASVTVVLALVFSSAFFARPGLAQQSQTEEEINRQVSRQLSSAISRRISERAPTVVEEEAKDSSVWGNFAYNRIEDDDGAADFEVDIYQGIGAYDRRFDRLFVGGAATVSYAESEFELSGLAASVDTESTSVGVNPYVAYLITEKIYAKLIAGYGHTFTDDADDTDSLSIEPSLNFVTKVEDFQVKFGGGLRVLHAFIQDFDDTTTLSYLAGGEVGVVLDNLKPFIRVDYEYVDPEDEADGFDNNQLFVSGGLEVNVADNVTIGLAGLAEVVNDDTNNYGGMATLRVILP